MPNKKTLRSLADDLIHESVEPFSAEDYLKCLQDRWRRRIAPDTLARLKSNLANHQRLIGLPGSRYLPYRAVLDRVGHIPIMLQPGKFELEHRILIPGHRLIPFLPAHLNETDLTFSDSEGNAIPQKVQSFYIEDVIGFYEYAGEDHFPDRIRVNEWVPGKSMIDLPVWDVSALLSEWNSKPGDGFQIKLLDYEHGTFQLVPYTASQIRSDKLRFRSLYLALESRLEELLKNEPFALAGLEKQLLLLFFEFDPSRDVPAFSLTHFIEALEKLAVVRSESHGLRFAHREATEGQEMVWEENPHVPTGATGSLEQIFQDMGLAFGEDEFKAILYVVMGSDDYNVESVFDLLFGGREDRFYNKRQHNAFYRLLRKLLNGVCEELNGPEPKMVSELRSKTVFVKLRLIEILRFFEEQGVRLEDLPGEILDQLSDLDGFSMDALKKLSDRLHPPEIKVLRDLRLTLKMILPSLDQLEEDVYYRLGIY